MFWLICTYPRKLTPDRMVFDGDPGSFLGRNLAGFQA